MANFNYNFTICQISIVLKLLRVYISNMKKMDQKRGEKGIMENSEGHWNFFKNCILKWE